MSNVPCCVVLRQTHVLWAGQKELVVVQLQAPRSTLHRVTAGSDRLDAETVETPWAHGARLVLRWAPIGWGIALGLRESEMCCCI